MAAFFGFIFGRMGASSGGVSGPGAGVDNYLLESGDNLLMEDGSVYLIE